MRKGSQNEPKRRGVTPSSFLQRYHAHMPDFGETRLPNESDLNTTYSGRMKEVFSALKSTDRSRIASAVTQLSSELSMTQESSMPSYVLDQLVGPLVHCLTMDDTPDIVYHSILCLAQLLDIRPPAADIMVAQGGLEILSKKLQDITSFELVEHTIKIIDKVAQEDPHCILTSNILQHIGRLLEFFDFTQQKNALRIMNMLIKSVTDKQELGLFVFPATNSLACLMKCNDNDSKSKEIMELVTNFFITIFELINHLYTSRADITNHIEKLTSNSITENLLGALIIAANSPNYSSLTPKSWSNVLKLLRYICKNSAKICKHAISNGLLNILKELVSTDTKVLSSNFALPEISIARIQTMKLENSNVIIEGCILLLDSILPYTHLLSPNMDDLEYTLEFQKERVLQDEGEVLDKLWEVMLPRMMQVYESIDSVIAKLHCLQIIDKLTMICDPIAITKMMPPQATAQFLYNNFCSDESIFACFGIRIAEMTMQRLSKNCLAYLKFMQREGVFEQIKSLQDSSNLKRKYGRYYNNEVIDPNNPYVIYFNSSISNLPTKEQPLPSKLGKRLHNSLKSRPCKVMFSNYIYTNAVQLLESYEAIKEYKEIKEANDDYKCCHDTAKQIKSLLKIGVAGNTKQWSELFQCIANRIVTESSFTNYEARHAQLFTYLYYALCMTPVEYKRKVLDKNRDEEVKAESLETKVRIFATNQHEDLTQMVLRHNTFMNAFGNTTLNQCYAMMELIKKLQESAGDIEKSIDDSIRGTELDSMLGKDIKIMIVYSPDTPKLKSSDLKRMKFSGDIVPEIAGTLMFKEKHYLLNTLHSLTFHINKSNTFKELSRFLKQKVRTDKDIAVLKGPHYYMLMKQQTEIKETLTRKDSFMQEVLKDHEMIQGMDEIIHSLNESEDEEMSDEEEEEEEDVPMFKGPNAFSISLPTAELQPETKVSFKFFYNGIEIKDKSQSVLNSILTLGTSHVELPRDIQGVLSFQIIEKPKTSIKKMKPIKVQSESFVLKEDYLFQGLSSEEQQAISLCQIELNSSIPQIRDKHVIAVINLLKLIYHKLRMTLWMDKTLTSNLALVNDESFMNPKLERQIKKRFQGFSSAISGMMTNDNWSKEMCCYYPFMISKNLRLLKFRVSTLDKDRGVIALVKALRVENLNQDLKAPYKRRKYKASREKIIDSGIAIMKSLPEKNCLLEFNFEDEVGSGLGPTMEFYSLNAAELRAMKCLWRPMIDGTLFPAPINPKEYGTEKQQQVLKYFEYMGWLVARSIADERLVDLPFAEIFWDIVLNKYMTLTDIARFNKKIAGFFFELEDFKKRINEINGNSLLDPIQKLQQIDSLTLSNDIKISDLALTFVLQEYDHIELKENGASILLTMENITEYLDLSVHYTFNLTVISQIKAFIKGFNVLFPVESLKFFKTSELEDLVCGDRVEQWDLAVLKENILPVYGYDNASPQYGYFLKYLSELAKEMQSLFLQYVTGSPRLPLGGFKSLNPRLSIAKRITPEGDLPDLYLPSVMTCQNYLKMPEYSTYAILKEKFDYALMEGQKSFTLSQCQQFIH